jgi:hypothetical protein
MAACIEMTFLSFKITLFSKNPLQAMTNTKSKILMDLQCIYTQKKIINWSASEKIQYGTENQDGCEFRIFVKILLPQHGLCLNLVLILYFMRLHSFKHEKRKK